jgi:hypothetical protein
VQDGDSEPAAVSPATSLSNAKTHSRAKRTQHADDHLTQPSVGRCVGAKGICALKRAGLTRFGGPALPRQTPVRMGARSRPKASSCGPRKGGQPASGLMGASGHQRGSGRFASVTPRREQAVLVQSEPGDLRESVLALVGDQGGGGRRRQRAAPRTDS